jgi:hypothetical protein
MQLHLYNYGPAGTESGAVTYEYTAPPGTERYDPHGAYKGPNCHWIVTRTHVRCTGSVQLWANYNGHGDYGGFIQFKVVSTVTGPGLYKVYCTPGSTCHDPIMGNNSAQIVINGAVTPKPTPKPTPKATPTAKPKSTPTKTTAAPTPSETATPTPADTVEPTPSSSPTPLTFTATGQDEPGLSLPWLAGGLTLLAALVTGALWWTIRRRSA